MRKYLNLSILVAVIWAGCPLGYDKQDSTEEAVALTDDLPEDEYFSDLQEHIYGENLNSCSVALV